MYLHLGQGRIVTEESILGVFDLDNSSQSHLTRRFLRRAEEEGRVINAAEDLPRSFVVCQEGKQIRVYLSQMTSSTLLRRSRTGRI